MNIHWARATYVSRLHIEKAVERQETIRGQGDLEVEVKMTNETHTEAAPGCFSSLDRICSTGLMHACDGDIKSLRSVRV